MSKTLHSAYQSDLNALNLSWRNVDFESVLVICFVIWSFSGLDVFMGVKTGLTLALPKYWIFLFTGVAVALMFLRPALISNIPIALIYWVILFIVVTMIWRVLFPNLADAELEFKDRRSICVFLYTCIVFFSSPRNCKIA